MDEMKEKIYPRLSVDNANDYRLEHIKEIRNYLEKDLENRRALSKKYSKVNNVLNYTNYTLNSISAASGIASIFLLSH